MTTKTQTEKLYNKILNSNRITTEEAIVLYHHVDLLTLGQMAHHIRNKQTHPDIVTYIVDRNINYTNICITHCEFCSFYRKQSDSDAYILKDDIIKEKLLETKSLGGTGILLQGGLNPKLKLKDYTSLLKLIKETTNIHIHAFSPPEITYLSKLEKKSLKVILEHLKEAGLNSIPGGGAEILVDSIRNQISPKKCSSQEWLSVMETAHTIGLKTTATMMFGHVESIEDRVEHLNKIRNLQDKTGGFTAFIPWTFQKGESKINCKNTYSYDYLKTLSLSRIFLDNIENIQGSWVTQGEQIGQLSLKFGANDLGSIMIEENVVKSAGTSFQMTEEKIKKVITEAGFTPFKRDTLYTNLPKNE